MTLPLRAPAGVEVRPERPDAIPECDSSPAPALEEPQVGPEAVEPLAGATAGGLDRPLVLVVEDNREMNRFIAQTLSPEYRVAMAFDGRDGLDKAVDLRPDAIVSDVMMPGLGGEQLLRAVRAREELEGVPFLLLSARADDEARAQLLRDGAQDYLVKPFSVAELRARLGNQLTMKRARDLLRQELASQGQDVAALAAEATSRNRALREANEALKRAHAAAEAALRARNEFVSIAAHELKTPLAGVRAAAQLLARQLRRGKELEPGGLRARTEAIEQQAIRLSQLVARLFDVSRLEAGQLTLDRTPTDVAGLVARVVAAAQLQAQRHALVVHASGRPVARVDPLRVEQVLSNLLDNALKFSPDGGQIDVQVAAPDKGTVRLAVRDRGLGIPPERRARIFEQFYQAHGEDHRSGLGLGLHICRQLVELHGGRIWAEFPSDGGTRFVVTLPTGPEAAPARPGQAAVA